MSPAEHLRKNLRLLVLFGPSTGPFLRRSSKNTFPYNIADKDAGCCGA
jgi:hypothetical protein